MDQPPNQAGEMIAVQMRDEDRLDGVGIDPELVEADQRGGAAVDEEARVPPPPRGSRSAGGRPSRTRRRNLQPSVSWHVFSNGRTSSLQAWTWSARLVCSLGNRLRPRCRQQLRSSLRARPGRDLLMPARKVVEARRPLHPGWPGEVDGHQRRDVGHRIVVPGDEAPLAQLLVQDCRTSCARGLLASPQAATCGTSSWAAAGCRCRKA